MLSINKLYEAKEKLKNVCIKTDLIETKNIFKNTNVYLKAENLQITGAFKLRGAYYKMSTLTDEQKNKGVIACSAGNHAQGVALSAMRNNVKATIFIPSTAPLSKIEATKSYGAEVRLIDGVYDDAYEAAVKFQKETGGEFIHPFDDIDIIAGQGTIGLELIEQLPDIDAVVVPIGGGGLIAGIAFAIKTLKPKCKVYGVQAMGAGSMYNSLINNRIIELSSVSTFADGTAVKLPGKYTFEMCKKYVDEIVTVTDDEIATAILTLMEKQKLVAEGAGALSVAAVMFDKLPIKDKKVVCIVSGGNIDVSILSKVINRGLLKAGRISDLTIELLDKPGQLKEVSTIIADHHANVIRVQHKQGGANTDINGCYLRVTLETRNHSHVEEIRTSLINAGYKLLKNEKGYNNEQNNIQS